MPNSFMKIRIDIASSNGLDLKVQTVASQDERQKDSFLEKQVQAFRLSERFFLQGSICKKTFSA